MANEFDIQIGLTVDDSEINAIQEKISKGIQPIKLELEINNVDIKSLMDKFNKLEIKPNVNTADLEKAERNISKSFSKIDFSDAFKSVNKEMRFSETQINKFQHTLSKKTKILIDDTDAQKAKVSVEKVGTELAEVEKKSNIELRFELNKSDLEKNIEGLLNSNISQSDKSALEGINLQLSELSVNSDNASVRLKDLGNQFSTIKANAKLGNITEQFKIDFKSENLTGEFQRIVAEQNNVDEGFIKVRETASRTFGESSQEIRKFVTTIDNGSGKITQLTHSVNTVTGEVRELGSETLKASNAGRDGLKSMIENFFTIGTAIAIANKAIQTFKSASKEVLALSDQMSNIQMVTGDSASELENKKKMYQELSRDISSHTTDVLESADAWLRQGLSISETNEAIKASQIFSKIGQLETAQATELLTSSMNGYGLEVENLVSIIDKIVKVDIEAATSTEELAIAMSRTATGANLAGVSMDRLLGYVGTVSEVTRDSAESIGNAFKTIFSRIQKVKLGSLIDDDGEDISNVETVLGMYGIKLRDSNKVFRDTEIILGELAEKWETLAVAEKQEIAEQISGVHQREKFLVLMENYDRSLELTEASLDSAGMAMQQFGIYEESASASTERFKNELSILADNLLDSGLLKGIINLGTELLKFANTDLGQFFIQVTAIVLALQGLDKAGNVISGITTLGSKIAELAGFGKSAGDSMGMLSSMFATAGKSAVAANIAFLGVSAALAVGVAGFIYWNKQQEELRQTALDASKSANEQVESLKQLRQEYENIVNSEQSVAEKNQQLAEFKQKLIDVYGFEKDAIKDLNLEREKSLTLLDAEILKSQRNAVNEGLTKMGSQYDNSVNIMENRYRTSTAKTGNLPQGLIETLEKYNFTVEQSGNRLVGLTTHITTNTKNLSEQKANLEALLPVLREKDNLTSQEQRVLYSLERQYKSISKTYDEWNEVYSEGSKLMAQNYILKAFEENKFASVDTAESFKILRDEMLQMAGSSQGLRKALLDELANTFPQFSDLLGDTTLAIEKSSDLLKSFGKNLSSEQKINIGEIIDFDVSDINPNKAFGQIKSSFDSLVGELELSEEEALKLKVSLGLNIKEDNLKQDIEKAKDYTNVLMRGFHEQGSFTELNLIDFDNILSELPLDKLELLSYHFDGADESIQRAIISSLVMSDSIKDIPIDELKNNLEELNGIELNNPFVNMVYDASHIDYFAESIDTIKSTLKSGLTETEEFRNSMQSIFAKPPLDLNKSLENISLLFSNTEEDMEKMFDLLRKHSNDSGINFKNIQDELNLTDEATQAFMARLGQMGLMLSSEVSFDTIGNGLGLSVEKAYELEVKLSEIFDRFEHDEISLEQANQEFANFTETLGLTDDALADLTTNWNYMLEGLSENTITAFAGIGGKTSEQVGEIAKASIDTFNTTLKEELANNNFDFESISLDGLIDIDGTKQDIEAKLRESKSFTEVEIEYLSHELSNRVFGIKLKTTIETLVDSVDIPSDQQALVSDYIMNAFNSETSQFDVLTSLTAVIDTVDVPDKEKEKIKDAVERNVQDNKIDLNNLKANLDRIGEGVSDKIIPIAKGLDNINSISLGKIQEEEKKLKDELEQTKQEVVDLTAQLKNVDSSKTSNVTSQVDNLKKSLENAERRATELQSSLRSLSFISLPSIPSTPLFQNATGAINHPKGESLVGEEGAELVISRDGDKRIVGKNGAELTHIDEGDTILPADITKRVLSGDIPMYSTGRIPSGGFTTSSSSSAKKETASKTKSSSSKEKELKEIELNLLMQMEDRYKDIDRLISSINKQLEDTTLSTEEKNNLLDLQVKYLKEQQALEHKMNESRRKEISEMVSKLRNIGLDIVWTPEINQLEFNQSMEEIQSKINSISLGDVDETNKHREELKKLVEETVKLNDANQDASQKWNDLNKEIQKINFNKLKDEYDDIVKTSKRATDDLNEHLSTLGNTDFDEKISVTNMLLRQTETSIEQAAHQMDKLRVAFKNGEISGEDFKNTMEELESSVKSSTRALHDFQMAIEQLNLDKLNNQKDAMMGLVDMVKNLIKMENDQAVQAKKDEIDTIKREKDANKEKQKNLKDELTARKKIIDERKKDLQNQLKAEKDAYNAKKKALDDETKAYKKLIDLKKKELDLIKDQNDYQNNLDKKQTGVKNIEDRLIEIAGNDSKQAEAERKELLAELADKKKDLDDFLLNSSIDTQKKALDSEYDRFKELQDLKKDELENAMKQKENDNERSISMLEREYETFKTGIENQIDDLDTLNDAKDKLIDSLNDDITAIQDQIRHSGDLTRLAMERIDKDGEALYDQLIAYNAKFGTGIDQDVIAMWDKFNEHVGFTNENTLQRTSQIMQEILDKMKQIASMDNSFSGTVGLRDYFESTGVDVGWNDSNRHFTLNGKEFDSSGYKFENDRIQLTLDELQELEKKYLNSYDTGGYITADQKAFIHKGERVLNKVETEDLHSILPEIMKNSFDMMNMQGKILSNLSDSSVKETTIVNNNSPELNVYNTISVSGNNNDELSRDFDSKLKQNTELIFSKFNKAIKGLGAFSSHNAF